MCIEISYLFQYYKNGGLASFRNLYVTGTTSYYRPVIRKHFKTFSITKPINFDGKLPEMSGMRLDGGLGVDKKVIGNQ